MRQSFAKSLQRMRSLSLSGTVQTVGRFVRRQLWVWPILAAVLFGGVGWWVHATVEATLRREMAATLQTILKADVTALRTWMEEQAANAQILTLNDQVVRLAQELVTLESQAAAPEQALLQARAQADLRASLAPSMKIYGYTDFFLVSPSSRVLASRQDAAVGKPLTGYRQEFFQKVLQGKPAVSLPFRSPLLLPDEQGELKAGLPSMFAATALCDKSGKPFAVLGLRIRPDGKFTEIIQVARQGATGETFAFDRRGLFLSQSRFDDDLKRMGLLADQPDTKSVLTLELRDPQVNMTEGHRPSLRRQEQPLTRMAAEAVAGKNGVDVEGYRDYRGVPVIGAWVWLPDHDFGMATEIDVAEAFQSLYIMRIAFWSLLGLLAFSAVAIFLFMLLVARQQVTVQRAVLAAKQLGQYSLEEKIGSGGMGSVYRARHALLRRPTAVKLLDPEKISDLAIARFEREVQLTSQLTHPNTIAIYDYGRTPEGLFFYAMEYLDGINLEDLVVRFGPLPEGRVVAILRQVCGSLAEAHEQGLIHRDIKPANILLNYRGGVADFVKVLDFGLARALDTAKQARLTTDSSMVGTPLYLAPETIQQGTDVDARADLYAVAAVGYFLLTATPVFEGKTIMDTFMMHIATPPQSPSERRGRAISPALESLLLRGLAKTPADRPATAKAFLEALEKCYVSEEWSTLQAEVWWTQFKAAGPVNTPAVAADTSVVGQTMDFPAHAG